MAFEHEWELRLRHQRAQVVRNQLRKLIAPDSYYYTERGAYVLTHTHHQKGWQGAGMEAHLRDYIGITPWRITTAFGGEDTTNAKELRQWQEFDCWLKDCQDQGVQFGLGLMYYEVPSIVDTDVVRAQDIEDPNLDLALVGHGCDVRLEDSWFKFDWH